MANLNLTLKVWRQKNANDRGVIETHEAKDIPQEASFLEMLDIVNERVIADGGLPIVFDHDCPEPGRGQIASSVSTVIVRLASSRNHDQAGKRDQKPSFHENTSSWGE